MYYRRLFQKLELFNAVSITQKQYRISDLQVCFAYCLNSSVKYFLVLALCGNQHLPIKGAPFFQLSSSDGPAW